MYHTIFTQLAKKYHPDHNKEKGAAAKFTEVGEAYEVGGALNHFLVLAANVWSTGAE